MNSTNTKTESDTICTDQKALADPKREIFTIGDVTYDIKLIPYGSLKQPRTFQRNSRDDPAWDYPMKKLTKKDL